MAGSTENQPGFAILRHSPQGKQGKPSELFTSPPPGHPKRQQPPEQHLVTSPLPTFYSHGDSMGDKAGGAHSTF